MLVLVEICGVVHIPGVLIVLRELLARFMIKFRLFSLAVYTRIDTLYGTVEGSEVKKARCVIAESVIAATIFFCICFRFHRKCNVGVSVKIS